MGLTQHLLLILAACALDALVGDPVYRLHPIRVLGAWTLACERWLFARGLDGRLGGVLLWAATVGGALGGWWLVHAGLILLHPWLAFVWDLFIAYSLLCARDLLNQGRRVLLALDDLPLARRELQMLVSRDTETLPRAGVVRATIESLSENLTDGVLTPLWALCLFGLPGLILVKVVSNLDSMVGYKNARYARFGWAGARSDDLVHWLPARLAVLVIMLAAALLRLHPRLALSAALRDHAMLPSPNSGWSEAACAGALRVRLVGPIWHQGRLVNEAYMGEPDWPAELDAEDLRRALLLVLVACLIALAVGLALAPLRSLMPW
ncbi:cobalamin biosynthesis protein CobD [Lamprobacter modestohalophilus]|uniref:Cobalamin biosynthesis protein CobD n=1 Tax=Lamprobacter modestohalophilus TaxID=1064514 RepID=A0A9X0W6V2_9GAMM|nr:adenosylcobinamide-phosphate synthase CbiB [Lamprobacter modestohalophilus]MBK1617885.1 cobalamin biosynthesis protein CobD [Lamprobacter modestohalophilus]